MGGEAPACAGEAFDFLTFYDDALPQVYGYLSARCRPAALAEDLTAETFLAAVDAARREEPPPITVPWVIGVARHKLVDHWRRQARQERGLSVLEGEAREEAEPWEVALDRMRVDEVLDGLHPAQRAALTLRYLDDLPVPQVARLLGRTVHATEALLVRARAAFRRAYDGEEAAGA